MGISKTSVNDFHTYISRFDFSLMSRLLYLIALGFHLDL